MKCVSLATLALAALGLGACAGMVPPSAEEMAKLPVVRYGEAVPAGGDYVLLYPAGATLPVSASVTGSLLAKPAQAKLEVATNRDVYVYRTWVSFDGKTWVAGNKAVDGEFEMHLPGDNDARNPGTLAARFDLKL